jgi:Ca2+/Na+ antiporter
VQIFYLFQVPFLTVLLCTLSLARLSFELFFLRLVVSLFLVTLLYYVLFTHTQRERERGESCKLRRGFVPLMNLQWDSVESHFTCMHAKTPPTTATVHFL